tara:strand:+ start:1379 stop:1591 length:213 start_codon:yes stop_codon:yes gene_type:complete
MKYETLDTICKNLINGNVLDAMKMLQNGCKTKPFLLADRCFEVQNELLGLGQPSVAKRFIANIRKIGEQS